MRQLTTKQLCTSAPFVCSATVSLHHLFEGVSMTNTAAIPLPLLHDVVHSIETTCSLVFCRLQRFSAMHVELHKQEFDGMLRLRIHYTPI